jgi:hypothetical protein
MQKKEKAIDVFGPEETIADPKPSTFSPIKSSFENKIPGFDVIRVSSWRVDVTTDDIVFFSNMEVFVKLVMLASPKGKIVILLCFQAIRPESSYITRKQCQLKTFGPADWEFLEEAIEKGPVMYQSKEVWPPPRVRKTEKL